MSVSPSAQAIPLRDVLDALPLSLFWKDASSRYIGCSEFLARPKPFTPEALARKVRETLDGA